MSRSCCLLLILLSITAPAQTHKIIILSGPKEHGVPGRHEYLKDTAILKYCLDNSGDKSISTELVVGKLPDLADLKTAAAIVIDSSGDRLANEYHPFFPPDPSTPDHKTYPPEVIERLTQIDKLMKQGVGLAMIHYSIHITNQTARQYMLAWVGGYYPTGVGKTIVNNDWTLTPLATNHPILRGIPGPWSDRDEFFIYNHLPEDPRRTNLLSAKAPNVDEGVVSWAYQRPEGGRGFVMSGNDFHANLVSVEPHRRLLLNGILWAAKADVPQGGASCTVPAELQ